MAKQGNGSGRLTASVIKSSGMVYELYCEICSEDGTNLEAEGYCVDCQDFLCRECVKDHRRTRMSRNHVLQDKSQMPQQKSSTSVVISRTGIFIEKCSRHSDRLVEYYCKDDRSLGCSVCMTVNHRMCNSVDHIPDLAEQLMDSQEYKQFNNTLNSLNTKSQNVIKRTKENVIQADTWFSDAASMFQELRKKINDAVDKFEADIKKKASDIKAADLKNMQDITDKGQAVFDEVQKISAKFQSLQSKNQLGQLFIYMIKLKDKPDTLFKLLEEADVDNSVTAYTIEPCSQIQKILDDPTSIGKLSFQATAGPKLFPSTTTSSLKTTPTLSLEDQSAPTATVVPISNKTTFTGGVVVSKDALTASMLAAAPPQEQKQMLDERLFPLIQRMHTELAGKITGMLLEMDNSELLHMLESTEFIKAKVMTGYDGKGKGFGFVSFEEPEAAERAVDEMNGKDFDTRTLYVGRAQKRAERQAELKDQFDRLKQERMNRFVGRFMNRRERLEQMGDKMKKFNNVYIKNFGEDIDDEKLKIWFEQFGQIISAKVMTGYDGKGKGFGFVSFEEPEAAERAVDEMNGKDFDTRTLYVGRAQKRAERQAELKDKFDRLKQERMNRFVGRFMNRRERLEQMGDKMKKFNNVYIKNFGEDIDDEKLKIWFEQFGQIISAKVMTGYDGKGKGFGFVSFEEPEAAERAVDEMNGEVIDTGTLYVGRAQKRAERQVELKDKFDRWKQERMNRYQGVNLYVKNLDDTIDDERLRKEFALFGTITSAKVMYENGRSKGFGFVCFSSPEEATKAVTEMNGRIIVAKPLYVARYPA